MPGSDSVNRFGAVLAASLAELDSRRREIDDLNVFPVADGDTGRNMVMTLRGLVEAIDSLRESVGGADLTDVNRDLVVKAVARAALSSAHGNSGVILSQLIRGAASELGSGKGRKVSPYLLARAMRGAADQGMAATPSPREGTMLTVARDIADALEEAYPDPQWLPDDINPIDQGVLLAEALEIAVEAGSRSVDRGPELLDVLREKGVVDAGGYGLVVIVAGALAGLRGEERSDLPNRQAPPIPVAEGRGPERYGFCVNFTVTGADFDPSAEAERVVGSDIGDSVLVVGDSEMIRVHVHTDDPDSARRLFDGVGEIGNFEQEDMNEQIRDRDERLGAGPRSHVVVVAHDPSVGQLFELDHVTVVDCDGELIIDAIGGSPAEEIVLVATSAPGVEAAGSALMGTGRKAELVAAENLAVALLALTAGESFDEGLAASLNARHLREDLLGLRAAGIRAASVGESQSGHLVGVVGDEAVAFGEPDEVAAAVLDAIGTDGFVTAVIDPSGPIARAALVERVAELDLSEAGLGEWLCVFAVEA